MRFHNIGVKSYPRGVTTNSESGIESYDIYYDVFRAMEKEGMVLNLHGEIPSDADKVCTVAGAEGSQKQKTFLMQAMTNVTLFALLPSNTECVRDEC
jgi:dihydroorotase